MHGEKILHSGTTKERCHYCRMLLHHMTSTRDHIVPLSRGGVDRRWNIVPACEPTPSEHSWRGHDLLQIRRLQLVARRSRMYGFCPK